MRRLYYKVQRESFTGGQTEISLEILNITFRWYQKELVRRKKLIINYLNGSLLTTPFCFHSNTALASSIAPVRALDNSNIYVVSGSTLYALANDSVSKGTIRWSSDSSAAKTKPPMAAVDVVYNVETNNGTIVQYNATTGSVSEGFPFGNPGSASGHSVLSDDGSTILMVLDNGTLISICVHCDSSGLVPSIAPSAILSQPTFFPSSFSQPPVFDPRFPASTPSQSGGFRKVLSPVLLTASAIASWVVLAL